MTRTSFDRLKISIHECLIVILVLLTSACDSPERPQVIRISNSAVFRPASPKEVDSIENAMASVITVCRDFLGLPCVDPVSVHLYKNAASLAYYAFAPQLPPGEVETLTAFARDSDIHINIKATQGEPWGLLVPLLAHEYAHNIHYSLTNNVPRFPVWFTEGFGVWVAAKTLHSLGWKDYDKALHAARQELIRYRHVLRDLSLLNDSRSWKQISEEPYGWLRTYTVAFVAVHNLIERGGPGALIEYLKSGNFEASFQISSERFLSEFQTFLAGTTPQEKVPFTFPKPAWKIGYEWAYEDKRPGKITTLLKRVMNQEIVKDIPTFVVRENDEDYFYSMRSLGLVATKKDGNLTTIRTRPNEFFAWPLEPSKEWRNVYTFEDIENKKSSMFDRGRVVSNLEQVRVPAGLFTAAKIQTYDNKSGRLEAEHWYAPNAKWIVKSVSYQGGDGFVREQQLLKFSTD